MGAPSDSDDAALSTELLAELHETAHVLDVVDEGHDIALDLHESLFSTSTRDRTLAFLQSERYVRAAEKLRRLSHGSDSIAGGAA